jgi:methylthioxylose transferase
MSAMSWLILFVQAALVFVMALAVGSGLVPLGVPGEWEWLRVKVAPPWDGLLFAGLGVAVYAGFAGLGFKSLGRKPLPWVETTWLTGLLAAAIAVQIVVPTGAAAGYDLSKWASVNYLPGSGGYFKVARQQAIHDPWKFMADYQHWIRSQDSLHIGTHPPGLIAAQCVLMKLMVQNPGLADFLLDHMPATVDMGFRVFGGKDPQPLSRSDRATLYATAILTLLACAGTVLPLYLLARVALPAPAAWAAAALWPLAPAANLFQPDADTAYPFLSTTALALAACATRWHQRNGHSWAVGIVMATLSGAVMAVGMFFTLAFLPVGLIVAVVVCCERTVSWRQRAFLIAAIGSGFLFLIFCGWAITGADPFVIGWWNLHHHARFYDEYPRTYRLWLVINPLELAIALGIPSVVWCITALREPRGIPISAWSTLLVLTLANLIGRNMGEVARLWLLYMPPLLVGAGYGCARWGSHRPTAVAGSIALLGAQTLALQSMIQVVYPV